MLHLLEWDYCKIILTVGFYCVLFSASKTDVGRSGPQMVASVSGTASVSATASVTAETQSPGTWTFSKPSTPCISHEPITLTPSPAITQGTEVTATSDTPRGTKRTADNAKVEDEIMHQNKVLITEDIVNAMADTLSDNIALESPSILLSPDVVTAPSRDTADSLPVIDGIYPLQSTPLTDPNYFKRDCILSSQSMDLEDSIREIQQATTPVTTASLAGLGQSNGTGTITKSKPDVIGDGVNLNAVCPDTITKPNLIICHGTVTKDKPEICGGTVTKSKPVLTWGSVSKTAGHSGLLGSVTKAMPSVVNPPMNCGGTVTKATVPGLARPDIDSGDKPNFVKAMDFQDTTSPPGGGEEI